MEIVDKQVCEFASSKGILKELVFTLMAKINEERVVVRNAERMVLGKKFKAIGFQRDVVGLVSQRRGRPKRETSD